MAKRILVNEGSKIKTISNVTKLVTRLQNGNMCTWVPEDELLLATKTIVKDGTYKAASEAGAPYGYSQVTVNGVGTEIMGELSEKSITKNGTYRASEDKDGPFYGYSKIYVGVSGGGGGDGGEPSGPITGKDDDDDDVMAEVDEDGNVVITKLPDTIQVVTPPTLTVYEDGQTIDFHGIEVKAYLPDGTEWGTVDNLELSFPEPIAEYDEEKAHEAYAAAEDSEIFNGSFEFSYTNFVGRYSDDSGVAGDFVEGGKVGYCFILKINEVESMIGLASDTPFNYTIYVIWQDGSRHGGYTRAANSFTFRSKTVYYYTSHSMRGRENVPVNDSTILVDGDNGAKAAWGCIYGNITTIPAGSTQTIPIQWHRPGDKKSLYGSFTITVNKPDDSGGQDPEPAPTPSPD